MKKHTYLLFIFLTVLVSSCEYDVSVESNSTGITISDDQTEKQEARTDIKFTASSEKIVEAGEVFELNYSINANGNFSPPDLNDFDVMSGPFSSSSSSTQIINGKRSSKISNSYVYNISAQTPGNYTISSAEITIGGHSYKSNSLNIKVLGDTHSADKTNLNPSNKIVSSNKDIFLLTYYSSTNIYKGDFVVATTKIYTLKDFQNISNIKFPDYEGFWTEVLEAPRQLKFQNELLNGKKYKAALLNQTLLFSQKTGNYPISPYEVEIQLRKKDGKTQDFFGNVVDKYKLINKRLTTKPQTITVKALPQPIPDNFSGITGKNITVNTQIDHQSIKTDESANLKIIISGNGNLHLLNDLSIELPEGLEHFKPQIEKTEKFSENGAYSERIFNFILVGHKTGDYIIKPFQFVYFDSDTKRYKTVSGKELNFNVGKGAGFVPLHDSTNIVSKDIRYMKTDNTDLIKINSAYAGSFIYYLTFVILLFIFILFLFIRRKYITANSDVLKVKKKNAGKVSQKRLKMALSFMKADNKQAFYKEILTSIWGYIGDKMSVSADSLTKESIQDLLSSKQISVELISKMMNVIEICGYAQYGPAGEEGKPENIYKETESVINELESYL